MKSVNERQFAYLLQKYEWNTELVEKHLALRGFSLVTADAAFWGRLIAAGADHHGHRLAWGDCGGDSDLGSGWGG